MAIRIYLSNLSPAWSFERQEALFDARMPDWRSLPIFRDDLGPPERRAHQAASLVGRNSMLRPSNRRSVDTFVVASPPCFAWDGSDFEEAMAQLAASRSVLRALDAGRDFLPDELPAALEAFKAGRERAKHEALQQAGAATSARLRRAATDAGVERVRSLWPRPAAEWPTYILRLVASETEAPVAYNTLVDRLGGRETAQTRRGRLGKKQKRKEAQYE